MSAMEPSKAMANSSQVQAAKARATAKAKEEADIQTAIQASLVEAQPKPQQSPKKSILRNKWVYIATASIVAGASLWYFRSAVNTKTHDLYNRLTKQEPL